MVESRIIDTSQLRHNFFLLNSAAVVAKVVGYFSHVWVKFVRFILWTTQHLPFLLGSSRGTPPCRGDGPCQSVAWWRFWRSGCFHFWNWKIAEHIKNLLFDLHNLPQKTRKQDLVSLFPCIVSFQNTFPTCFAWRAALLRMARCSHHVFEAKGFFVGREVRRDESSRFCNSWKVVTGSLSISYLRFLYLVHK